jgi:polyisoprenoid-binding protein YceI
MWVTGWLWWAGCAETQVAVAPQAELRALEPARGVAVVMSEEVQPVEAPAVPPPAPVVEVRPAPAPAPAPVPVVEPVVEPVPEPIPVPEPVLEVAQPRLWTLQPSQSDLSVLVRYERGTALASMAHDHVVAATGWTGTVWWVEGEPERCEISVSVPVTGLVVDPPGSRARAGLPGETPDEDKRKIGENLSGDRQLDGSRFPQITFRSTSCRPQGEKILVTGTLSLHGASRRIEVPMEITADERLQARGTFSISGESFGMQPFRAAMGAVRNQDRLDFTIDVQGR